MKRTILLGFAAIAAVLFTACGTLTSADVGVSVGGSVGGPLLGPVVPPVLHPVHPIPPHLSMGPVFYPRPVHPVINRPVINQPSPGPGNQGQSPISGQRPGANPGLSNEYIPQQQVNGGPGVAILPNTGFRLNKP